MKISSIFAQKCVILNCSKREIIYDICFNLRRLIYSSDKERSVQMSRATSPQTVIVGRPPMNATLVARFCRERAPRTCEHALLRRSRACARTESFLSKGDSLTLELKLTQGTALK